MDRQAFEAKLDRLQAGLKAVEAVADGGPSGYRIPPVAAKTETVTKNRNHSDLLTARETQVLNWVAEGNSTKQVADQMRITFKTAACHRYRIMDKLGIHETGSLVRYAIRCGLIEA
ncbi:MAG TPA: LuxR C-terminal-related transcriptional regulator [Bryobacteraceae bacterium]|nr:LuxR C-terminal-related transcriptional regulator [Bryobacteraceae bacterium]